MLEHPNPDDWEVVAGNTMLIEAGVPVSHTNQVRHPRTAVSLDAKRTKLVILVVDGRKPGIAVGMSYDELAAELIRLGGRDAINLDGGGSSVMAIRDPATGDFRILNEPTDGRERAVANVLGVSAENPSYVVPLPK
jgi:exopolysaccharide biosynthesis protein